MTFHLQVAQIYQSIEFSRLATLVPFVDAFMLERAIVDAARHCDLQVSLQHYPLCAVMVSRHISLAHSVYPAECRYFWCAR